MMSIHKVRNKVLRAFIQTCFLFLILAVLFVLLCIIMVFFDISIYYPILEVGIYLAQDYIPNAFSIFGLPLKWNSQADRTLSVYLINFSTFYLAYFIAFYIMAHRRRLGRGLLITITISIIIWYTLYWLSFAFVGA
jgi:hypothetical protein